jgi:UDP-N-acetylmuramoyl-tripeptide--D-alanyl-D-alanine ligase
MATTVPLNHCAFSRDEIVQATGALAPAPGPYEIAGVTIDSRRTSPRSLFVALRGIRDGHEFITAAAQSGGIAALVERGRSIAALPCFEVDDTLDALGALAQAHLARMRKRNHLPVIAIGGAAGKTTTKELTASIMRELYGEVLATPGNLNNLIGVPMTIFMLDEKHRAAVVECGTNQRGEIARLGSIVRPKVALVLNVDIEHTEGLGSLEGVADEEAALFATAGCAVVPTAERLLLERIPAGAKELTFGRSLESNVRLLRRSPMADGRQAVELELSSELVEAGENRHIGASIHLLGETAALNAAAATTAAIAALGRPLRRVHLDAIARALERVLPVDGRFRLSDRGGITVIDDSYNSNPRSLRAALTAAREIADFRKRRLAVAIGDMLELGDLSSEMHATALRDIFAARPDVCILVGPEMTRAAQEIALNWKPPVLVTSPDSDEAARALPEYIRRGDVLLVKGSRGIATERIIAALPLPG